MEEFNNTTELGNYDTAIKDISGLSDYSLIFNVIEAHCQKVDTLDNILNSRNEFGIRTEKTRKKVAWAINRTFLSFRSEDHLLLISGIFRNIVPHEDKKFAFYWQFALNNRLFREISVFVFSKVYFSGRATISKDDIIAYLKESIISEDTNQMEWSDNTIYRIATKYLSLMSKLNFVSIGRVKTFRHIRVSSEAQVLFLYFANLFNPNVSNILINELLPISFIPSEDIQERLKKLSMKGLFNMNFNGAALNIELTHSYKGICDVLYN
ncbi:BrxA family protein [Pseudomonadota bacterium]